MNFNNKNILMAAEQAKKLLKNIPIFINILFLIMVYKTMVHIYNIGINFSSKNCC